MYNQLISRITTFLREELDDLYDDVIEEMRCNNLVIMGSVILNIANNKPNNESDIDFFYLDQNNKFESDLIEEKYKLSGENNGMKIVSTNFDEYVGYLPLNITNLDPKNEIFDNTSSNLAYILHKNYFYYRNGKDYTAICQEFHHRTLSNKCPIQIITNFDEDDYNEFDFKQCMNIFGVHLDGTFYLKIVDLSNVIQFNCLFGYAGNSFKRVKKYENRGYIVENDLNFNFDDLDTSITQVAKYQNDKKQRDLLFDRENYELPSKDTMNNKSFKYKYIFNTVELLCEYVPVERFITLTHYHTLWHMNVLGKYIYNFKYKSDTLEWKLIPDFDINKLDKCIRKLIIDNTKNE